MTDRVAHGKALPTEVVEQVVAKTDGVPLFVEELTKMVLESGLLQEREERYELRGPLSPLAIPTTLHDSLMARLDRLATVKALAQLGATLGREFSYELLQAVAPWDEETLQQGLHQLVEAEFLYQRGLLPQATYLFKHALIQDAAYQSLLRSTRQQYHQRIAQVLEARFPETVEMQPELVAHHYTEAGLAEQAMPYWQRAGQHAIERSAHVEAISHLTQGLAVLTTLPDTPERLLHELNAHITLGDALKTIKGWGAPEVEQAYARALDLCRRIGDTPRLFPVLQGLWEVYEVQAALQKAHTLAAQLLTLAQRTHDPTLLLQAHQALGETVFFLGEPLSAREHLEQSCALYDPPQHRAHAFQHGGYDFRVGCRSFLALTLWLLGYPVQALQASDDAGAWAQELSHPFSLTFALGCAAKLQQLRRDGQATQVQAEVSVTLSTEQGFAFYRAHGTMLHGWALVEQGQREVGMAQIRQGLVAWQATGTEVQRPYFLALLAEAYGQAGQADEGLHTLAEALAVGQKTGERFYEAELYRLKGELLLQSGGWESESLGFTYRHPHAAEAEACFLQAIEVARHQQAKSLELRATMSLARLWQQQGKQAEARALLAPIYAWFTEGFDTADLQEAKVMLEAWA